MISFENIGGMEMSTQREINSDPNNVSGKSEARFHSNSKVATRSASSLYDLLCLDTPSWSSETDRCSSSSPQLRLESLLHQSGNRFCADCGTPDPKWVSSNLGVFICIKCSGVHRSLGVQISKVLSVKLDEWTDEQVDNLETLGGNIAVNQKYEACIPNNLEKPKPDSSIEERSDFIRRKYEMLEFSDSNDQLFCPFPSTHKRSSSSPSSSLSIFFAHDKKQFEKQATRTRIGQAFRNSWARKDSEHKASKKCNLLAGMVEFIGLIKVNVVKGTNLAIRDVMTSDPFINYQRSSPEGFS